MRWGSLKFSQASLEMSLNTPSHRAPLWTQHRPLFMLPLQVPKPLFQQKDNFGLIKLTSLGLFPGLLGTLGRSFHGNTDVCTALGAQFSFLPFT